VTSPRVVRRSAGRSARRALSDNDSDSASKLCVCFMLQARAARSRQYALCSRWLTARYSCSQDACLVRLRGVLAGFAGRRRGSRTACASGAYSFPASDCDCGVSDLRYIYTITKPKPNHRQEVAGIGQAAYILSLQTYAPKFGAGKTKIWGRCRTQNMGPVRYQYLGPVAWFR
jgi:hypothetical protein